MQPVFGSQLAPVTGDKLLGSCSLWHPIDGFLLCKPLGTGAAPLVGVNVFCKQGGKREWISHKSCGVVASFPSADLGEVAGCKAWVGRGGEKKASYDVRASGARWAVNQRGLWLAVKSYTCELSLSCCSSPGLFNSRRFWSGNFDYEKLKIIHHDTSLWKEKVRDVRKYFWLLSPCRLCRVGPPSTFLSCVTNKYLSAAREVINEDNPSGRLSIW